MKAKKAAPKVQTNAAIKKGLKRRMLAVRRKISQLEERCLRLMNNLEMEYASILSDVGTIETDFMNVDPPPAPTWNNPVIPPGTCMRCGKDCSEEEMYCAACHKSVVVQ